MTVDDQLRKIILNRMDILEVNQTKLSQLSGVAQPTLSVYLTYDSPSTTTIYTLMKICDALELSLSDIFLTIAPQKQSDPSLIRDYSMTIKQIIEFMKEQEMDEKKLSKKDFEYIQKTIEYIYKTKK